MSKRYFTGVIIMSVVALNMCFAAKPLIVAHRGASKDAPENTLPSFTLAWAQGADAIEGDFYLTKDDYIVCIHDGDTKRTTERNLVVKETPFAELRKLDAGSWKSEKYKGSVIPLISEVFATIPDKKQIYIELKCGKAIVPKLLSEITKAGLKDEQVVVISFNKDVILEMKLKAPQYTANWLSGLEKDDQGNLVPSLETVLKTLKEIKADGFSSAHKYITEEFIKGVMEAGYSYYVWVVNDPQEAERFKKWGARSITTNVPGEILQVKNL